MEKRLYPTDSVKYLGVKIDSKLNWKSLVNTTATKLNQANAMLYKVRDFVNADILIMHYLNHTLTMLTLYGDRFFQKKINILIINYFLFLLLGLHFYQCYNHQTSFSCKGYL